MPLPPKPRTGRPDPGGRPCSAVGKWCATKRAIWCAWSRIDQPEAILVSPDQAFFLRENLKLKLLNARLGLLARSEPESARADLAAASAALNKYFDPASRRTQRRPPCCSRPRHT